MAIKSIQKVIKVGDSLAVTIPAKDARASNIVAGSEVTMTVAPIKPTKQKPNIDADYQAFTKQYGETLRNLADR